MLTSFWEDPEFADTMQAKKMYAELMKDPELAQVRLQVYRNVESTVSERDGLNAAT